MIKKKMSLLLAAVLVASGVVVAAPASAATVAPKVTYVAPSITMAEVGDEFSFALQSDVATNVQYQIWAQNTATGVWYSLTNGYTEAVKGTDPFIPETINTLPAGAYKASVWVKAEGSTAKFDSYTATSFKIQKDGYFNGRAKLDNLGLKDTYTVGEAVTVQGADQYKLHMFDPSVAERAKGWTIDATYETAAATADDYKFTKPGVYLVDVWGKKADSTNKYDGWALKVVTVEEVKGIAIESSIKEAMFGSLLTVDTEYTGAVKYQAYKDGEVLTKATELGKEASVFPAMKAGEEIEVKLLDAAGVVLATTTLKIGETAYVAAPVVEEPVKANATATVKEAMFGSLVSVTSDLKGAVKFQLVDASGAALTKVTDLGKDASVFPAMKAGAAVKVNLIDATGKVLATVETTLK